MMFTNHSSMPTSLTVDELLGFAKQFERPQIVKHFSIGIEESKELVEKQGFPDEIWVRDDFWEQLTSLPHTSSHHPFCALGTPVRRCSTLMNPYILHWRSR